MGISKLNLFSLAIVILSFVIAIFSYSYLPEKIISHWGADGNPNGYMTKSLGLFLMPLLSIIMLFLFYILPKIDPLKKNYNEFKYYYELIIFTILLFLFYIFLLTIIWNLGFAYNMNLMIIPAIGLLFIIIGNVLNKTKRNWFFGIRTPWTISSDKVWKKTHELGSKLFIVSGILTIIGAFFGAYAFLFLFITIIISTIWLLIYSYLEWKKLKK